MAATITDSANGNSLADFVDCRRDPKGVQADVARELFCLLDHNMIISDYGRKELMEGRGE